MDCAAGTGNLIAGLHNKYNIYASSIDQADINVMNERIEHGANLLSSHVFKFDFLNDAFDNLPQSLRDIISDPEKRKRLVVYINPPYAEADNRIGEGRKGVAESKIHKKYSDQMGYTKREMYIQFLTRIHFEIPDVILANFIKLKNLQVPRFKDFRGFFLTPAKTFDNVKGTFPIGFFIWNTKQTNYFQFIEANINNQNGEYAGSKNIWSYHNSKLINDLAKTFRYTKSESLATIIGVGNDFQNQR